MSASLTRLTNTYSNTIASTCLVIETLVFKDGRVLRDHLIQFSASTEEAERGKMTYQGHTAFRTDYLLQ